MSINTLANSDGSTADNEKHTPSANVVEGRNAGLWIGVVMLLTELMDEPVVAPPSTPFQGSRKYLFMSATQGFPQRNVPVDTV